MALADSNAPIPPFDPASPRPANLAPYWRARLRHEAGRTLADAALPGGWPPDRRVAAAIIAWDGGGCLVCLARRPTCIS